MEHERQAPSQLELCGRRSNALRKKIKPQAGVEIVGSAPLLPPEEWRA
jgi:hypothetical protein